VITKAAITTERHHAVVGLLVGLAVIFLGCGLFYLAPPAVRGYD
jgi:hypothetical protein